MMAEYLSFEHLQRVMQLSKEFREDLHRHPSPRQAYIFKIFRRQLRNIITIGFPSTIARIKYWNFKTKFYYGKRKKPNEFEKLKRLNVNEGEAVEI